jgi:type II secretion system protein L
MPRILGLDIGTHAVRGTLVRTAVRRSELLQYLEVPIEEAHDPQGRADALRDSVRSLLDQLGQRSPDGVVAELDGHEASLRIVDLPAGAAKRVGEVLPFELEAVLPFPVEEAVVDYQPIERDSETFRLLATAAPKSKVAARLEQLRDAGADARELAVGAAALEGLTPVLPQLQTGGPHVLVDVGEHTTDVCILREGRCHLARTLSSGMTSVREGRRGALEAQLRHTLANYRAQGGAEPEVVFLAGDAASFPNATEWLGEIAGVECRVLPLPPAEGADDSTRPRFARATALAGRVAYRGKRLDLRQGEFARPRAMGALRQHTRLIAICAAVVLLSFSFSSYARWAILADEREALRGELSRMTERLFDEEATTPDQARALLTGKAGPSDPLPRFDAFDVLDAISRSVPDGITHDTRRLHIELEDKTHKGSFEMEASVDSNSEAEQIRGQLNEHRCIEKANIGRITSGPGNEGRSYRLEAVVKCPDSPAAEEDGDAS